MVTRLGSKHDTLKWCDRKAITQGRSPCFVRTVRGHALLENLKIEMLRYAFSAQQFWEYFRAWIKASFCCLTTSRRSATGWAEVSYVFENQPTFCKHHTGWSWLSSSDDPSPCVLISVYYFEDFPICGGRNSVEKHCWKLFSLLNRWTTRRRCARIPLSLSGLNFYGLVRRTRANEWQLGGCPFWLHVHLKNDSSCW